jgi:hypothetical protein
VQLNSLPLSISTLTLLTSSWQRKADCRVSTTHTPSLSIFPLTHNECECPRRAESDTSGAVKGRSTAHAVDKGGRDI